MPGPGGKSENACSLLCPIATPTRTLRYPTTLQPSVETAVVNVDPKALSDYYSDSPVFRGYLQQPRRPWERASVALKFAMRGDLIGHLVEEAELYLGPLAPLQGSTVPRYHGLYIGLVDDEGDCMSRLGVLRRPAAETVQAAAHGPEVRISPASTQR